MEIKPEHVINRWSGRPVIKDSCGVSFEGNVQSVSLLVGSVLRVELQGGEVMYMNSGTWSRVFAED